MCKDTAMNDEADLQSFLKHSANASFVVAGLFAVFFLAYLIIHVWVTAHAFGAGGWLAAIVTFCLPMLADGYWGVREWLAAGPTTFALAACINAAMSALSYPLSAIGRRWAQGHRQRMVEALEDFAGEIDELEDVELLDPESYDDEDGEALAPRHVAVLRQVHLDWNGAESGAPCFHPDRPLGDGDFWQTLCALTDATDREQAAAVWRGMGRAWAEFVERAALEPGRYEIRPVSSVNDPPVREAKVTEETLILARTLAEDIDWEEDFNVVPGPSCDPKRPYGDYTNYPIDMAYTLGWDERVDTAGDYAELSEEDDDYLTTLHCTAMLPTMQAILQHGRLDSGTAHPRSEPA